MSGLINIWAGRTDLILLALRGRSAQSCSLISAADAAILSTVETARRIRHAHGTFEGNPVARNIPAGFEIDIILNIHQPRKYIRSLAQEIAGLSRKTRIDSANFPNSSVNRAKPVSKSALGPGLYICRKHALPSTKNFPAFYASYQFHEVATKGALILALSPLTVASVMVGFLLTIWANGLENFNHKSFSLTLTTPSFPFSASHHAAFRHEVFRRLPACACRLKGDSSHR